MGMEVTVWAILMLIACDLPAVRKLLGLGSHSGYHSCSKCDKEFSSIETDADGKQRKRVYCNDFEVGSQRRTRDGHIAGARRWQDAATDLAAERVRQKTGYRYIHSSLP